MPSDASEGALVAYDFPYDLRRRKFDANPDRGWHHRIMRSTLHHVTELAIVGALAGILVACGTGAETAPVPSRAEPTATLSSAQPTKPLPAAQSQLPLPTTVRWAIDKGSPDDPQQRSRLILFYDGIAQGWRVLDGAGAEIFRVPIAGSGIFGPDTCVVKARRPNEVVTWVGLDTAALTQFMRDYQSYRAMAAGVPTGSATLTLTDSGCRGA